MATYLENLKTRRDTVAQNLANATTAGGQTIDEVSTDLDGEKLDFDKLVERWHNELKYLNEEIARQEGVWTSKSVARAR